MLVSVSHKTEDIGGGGKNLLLRVSIKSGQVKLSENIEIQKFTTIKIKHQPPST